jgi:2-methylcitrate dehydratase PrpD
MFVHPEQTTRESLPRRFAEVVITLADGRRLERRVHVAKGQPGNPLSEAELEAKFRDCAGRALPGDRVEIALKAIQSLDRAPDVGELCRALGTA